MKISMQTKKFAVWCMIQLNMECYGTIKEEVPDATGLEMRIGGSFREDLTQEMLPGLSIKG